MVYIINNKSKPYNYIDLFFFFFLQDYVKYNYIKEIM